MVANACRNRASRPSPEFGVGGAIFRAASCATGSVWCTMQRRCTRDVVRRCCRSCRNHEGSLAARHPRCTGCRFDSSYNPRGKEACPNARRSCPEMDSCNRPGFGGSGRRRGITTPTRGGRYASSPCPSRRMRSGNAWKGDGDGGYGVFFEFEAGETRNRRCGECGAVSEADVHTCDMIDAAKFAGADNLAFQ